MIVRKPTSQGTKKPKDAGKRSLRRNKTGIFVKRDMTNSGRLASAFNLHPGQSFKTPAQW
jgi:hypothetical protein